MKVGKLYQKYKDRGLVVIGFPCNQFMRQEPGDEQAIPEFCSLRYSVTFPCQARLTYRGDSAIPLYKRLAAGKVFTGTGGGLASKAIERMFKIKNKGGTGNAQIKWNFNKFLVDSSGNFV